jgi:RNA-directed DNA polymerase
MQSRNRRGFGWKRWSKDDLYAGLELFNDYRIQHTS